MIKETCSCGASFEASGPKADARVAEWRVGHLLHGNATPTYIPSYPIYPTYPRHWWEVSPTITSSTGRLQTVCEALV